MKKSIANLFFLFLTSPILSPFIGGITLYLSLLIVFFDINFFVWLKKSISRRKLIEYLFLSLLLLLVTRSPTLIMKSMMLLFSSTYTFYCYINDRFYLYRWVAFNILIALLQFAFIFINMDVAVMLGPTNIASKIWGNFAGPTFTNFYSISILPRVSGLSREGGFFASLLGVTFFLLVYDKKKTNHKAIYFIIIAVGLLISLSKTSLFILIVPIIIALRRYINLLSVWGVVIIYSLLTTEICYNINNHTNFFKDPENISFLQRFAGYTFAPYADVIDYFMGIKLPELLTKSQQVYVEVIAGIREGNLIEFNGMPYFYLGYGVISFLIFILLLTIVFELTAAATLVIIILTINVTPLTNDGFVVLAWLLAFLISNKKKKVIKYTDQFLPINNLNKLFS